MLCTTESIHLAACRQLLMVIVFHPCNLAWRGSLSEPFTVRFTSSSYGRLKHIICLFVLELSPRLLRLSKHGMDLRTPHLPCSPQE